MASVAQISLVAGLDDVLSILKVLTPSIISFSMNFSLVVGSIQIILFDVWDGETFSIWID